MGNRVHGAIFVVFYCNHRQVFFCCAEFGHVRVCIQGVVGGKCHAEVVEFPEVVSCPSNPLHRQRRVDFPHFFGSQGHRDFSMPAGDCRVSVEEGCTATCARGLTANESGLCHPTVFRDNNRWKKLLVPSSSSH